MPHIHEIADKQII